MYVSLGEWLLPTIQSWVAYTKSFLEIQPRSETTLKVWIGAFYYNCKNIFSLISGLG